MVQVEQLTSAKTEKLYRDDLMGVVNTDPGYIRADQIEFNADNIIVDTSSVNGSPVPVNQSSNLADIIKFLKEEHYNYIKSLQRYYDFATGSGSTEADRVPCSGDIDEGTSIEEPQPEPEPPAPPPPPPDDNSGTEETSSTSTGRSSDTNNSSGDYSNEDYVDMMSELEDAVDDTIEDFANGGYSSADAEAIAEYQERIQNYLNLMRLLAMLLSSRLELVALANEQMSDTHIENSSSCLKIVNGFCANRSQMVSAQLAQLFEYIMEKNEAYYDKQKKKIEEEYNHWYSSQKKKEQELADAAKQYEKALEETVESMAAAFASAGNINFDNLSADEAAEQMESISAALFAAATDMGYQKTDNGYYNVDSAAMEEYRSILTKAQNLARNYLIIYDAKNEVRRVVTQILTGNQAAQSNKEAVIGAYEDKFVADVATLENIFSVKLKLMEVHNTKIYHQKQVEKHEKSLFFDVMEWVNKGLSIVVGIVAAVVSCIYPPLGVVLGLISAALWVTGEAFDLAGQYYADSQVDDELDISEPNRDEEDPDSPEVYEGGIPSTSAQQDAIDELDEIGYVEKDDGLLYMDSTQVAEALGDLAAVQNRNRILLAAIQSRFDVASVVYQSVYGISLSNNYNLVQSVYEAKNQQYLFMFQLRSYLKEQKRYYQNLELAQAKNLEIAAWTFAISSVCSAVGAFLGAVTGLGFLSSLFGGLADILVSEIFYDWYKSYENLEAGGNVTSIDTEKYSDDPTAVDIDKQEQQILEDALQIGMMETGTNGFGMSYVMVDPAEIAVIRQRLAAIQTLRMCLILAQRAMAQINNIVNAELTGIVPNGRAYELSMQVAWAQNQVINQQLQQIISFKSQQAQLQNAAADAQRQYYQGWITGGISVGTSAIGGALGYSSDKWGKASDRVVDGIYTATDVASRLGSATADLAFNWSDATRDSSLLDGLDPQKILIEALDEYYATTRGEKEGGEGQTISKEELEILTQITSELIESMKGGQWGINSGLQIYFSNLMEQVYRLQECVAKATQAKTEIAGAVHQKLTGKPTFSTVDAQLLLSAHQAKALGFVSDMLSCLEQITIQHNRMTEARKQMWLSVLDMAVTLVEVAMSIAANANNTKLKQNQETVDKLAGNLESMDAEWQKAISDAMSGAISDEQLQQVAKDQAPIRETTNANRQKASDEIISLLKELAFDQALRTLISLFYPWIRVAVDKAIITPIIEKNNEKEGIVVELDTATDSEMTNMHRETIALSLQSGEALLASTEAAASYESSMEMFDTFWGAAQNCLQLMQDYGEIHRQLDKIGANDKARVDKKDPASDQSTKPDEAESTPQKKKEKMQEYCQKAAGEFTAIVDEISALRQMLASASGDPKKVKEIIERTNKLVAQMDTLEETVDQADQLLISLPDSTRQDLPVPLPHFLQMLSRDAMSQFSQQAARSTTALNAYLSTLEQQVAQAQSASAAPAASPAVDEKSREEAQQAAQTALDELAETAAQLSDSEVISTGLSQDFPQTEAVRRSIVNAEGKPLSELSEEELLVLLSDRRGLRDALLQSKQPEVGRKLEAQIRGLEQAIQDAKSGKNVPEGIDPADYIKMLEAEKVRAQTQAAEAANPKKATDWAAVKATTAEINLILSELRNRVKTRLSGSSGKSSGNCIKLRMSETEKSACVERELNNLLDAHFGTPATPTVGTASRGMPEAQPAMADPAALAARAELVGEAGPGDAGSSSASSGLSIEISQKSSDLTEQMLSANLQRMDAEQLRDLLRKLIVEEVWISQQPQTEQLTQYRSQVAQAKVAVEVELEKREKAKTSAAREKRRPMQMISGNNYYRQQAEAELAERSLSSRTTTAAIS